MALEKLKTETRQRQILEAAIALIAAQGVRRLRVTSLARRVGLAPSALYRHFRGKQQIVEAAMQRVQRQTLENLREVCSTTTSALERLKFLLTRVIKMTRELQAMPQMVFAGAMCGGRPQHTLQADGFFKGVLAAIEAVVREGQERGEIRTDLNATSLAVMFWGMLPPAVILWRISGGEFDVTRYAENAWKLYSESLQSK